MGTKALIFGSCPCAGWSFLAPWRDWPDVVIAADGGLSLARDAGFSPTVYIGDGDSGGRVEPELTCVTLPVEKDVTDLEAAYLWAKDYGADQLVFTGCTGGRLDHHMAAMGLLETAAKAGCHGVILDAQNRVEFLLPGTHRLQNFGYRYFSLLPVDAWLRGLTIHEAKYPLEQTDVQRGSSLTVSNEFMDDPVELSFAGGCCYLIYSA